MKGVIFLSKILDKVKIIVEFTEASTRANIASGESLKVILGKIKKVITDLHDSAFTGNAAKVNGHTVESNVPSNAVFTDTKYSAATTNAAGLMSASDKTKLDGIASGANAYTHPTTAGNKHIPSGGSSGQILRWSASGTAVWGSETKEVASLNVSLTTSGWSNKSQTVTVTGITASNNVIISPDSSSLEKYLGAGVICTSQAANSLTFTCDTVPTVELKVNILIFS